MGHGLGIELFSVTLGLGFCDNFRMEMLQEAGVEWFGASV